MKPSVEAPAPAIVVRAPAGMSPAECACGGVGGICSCQPGQAPGLGMPASISPVYAFGSLRMTYPSRSLEKEMKSAMVAMKGSFGSIADQYLQTGYGLQLLGQGQYDYILRDACFILTIGEIDAYLVQARGYPERHAMVAASNQQPAPSIYSAIIGPLGPVAGPEVCNGLQLPIVYCNQIFSTTAAAMEHYLQTAIGPDTDTESQSQQMFQLLMQMTDNTGSSPEHRALNYVALRYPLIYKIAATMYQQGFRLIRIEVTSSSFPDARDIVFTYQMNDIGQLTQWRCSIDVSGLFPYIVGRLSQSYPTHGTSATLTTSV